MTATNQSPYATVPHLRFNNHRKTTSFEDSETGRESYGSSSDDTETHSPKSVVRRTRRRPATEKNVEVFGRRVRNQIERIRAEDSHLGKDIGECLIVKICGSGQDDDVMIFSMPASPLSSKAADRLK